MNLLEERAELDMAYSELHAEAKAAQEKCQQAKKEVLAFDEEHPEVMQAVHAEAGARKREVHAAEIAALAEEEADDNDS